MILQTKALTDLEVTGAEYPPPPGRRTIARAVFFLQLALFGFMLYGESAFSSLNMATPAFYKTMAENKMMSFMGIWMISNMVQNALLSTQAFEIHHGDTLVWSSLQEQRLPGMADLIKSFAATGVEFSQSAVEQ